MRVILSEVAQFTGPMLHTSLGMIPALQPWNAKGGHRGAVELHSLSREQLRVSFLTWWSGWAASSVGPCKEILTRFTTGTGQSLPQQE